MELERGENMASTIDEIYSIEEEAQQLEEKFAQQLRDLDDRLESDKRAVDSKVKDEIEQHRKAQESKMEQDLYAYKESADRQFKSEQQALGRRFEGKKEDLVNYVVDKVVKTYGHS